MAQTKVIRYRTRPEHADENERLVRAVFAELAECDLDTVHYTVLRLDDGVSFVHVATFEGEANPLGAVKAFGDFVAGVGERCEEGPITADAAIIGSHRMHPG